MTALPNPWISNPSVTPEPPTEGPAVALSRTSVLDAQTGATAELIPSSCGDENAHQSRERCADNRSAFSEAVEVASDPHEAIPSNEGRPSEASAPAPTKNPDADALGTDCIHEIFHWVRKLMRGHQGFVLDEAEFLADVEEEPLFIRDGAHLRRWEA